MTSNTASSLDQYQPISNNVMATYTAGALGQLFFAVATCHVLSNSILQTKNNRLIRPTDGE